MKVFVVFDDSKVQIAGDNAPVVLDLIAHFVGLVTPHNANVAPSVRSVRDEPPRKLHEVGCALIFPEILTDDERVQARQAHMRLT